MKAGRIAWRIAALLPLCAAQAGEPPTAKIMVNPVPAKVGPPYPPLIGGGANIVANELRLDAGGVRVWVEVQLKDWDPNGDGSPAVFAFVAAVDGSGLLDADINGDGSVDDDGDQMDIALAKVPCTSNAVCRTAFGEDFPESRCDHGTCLPVYTDKAGYRADGWCAGASCDGADAYRTVFGWIALSTYYDDFRPDDGTVRWGATAVYDVPPGARGKYTVQLNTDRTYLLALIEGPGIRVIEVPSLSETGFVINILTGRCCFGFGTPSAGCVDSVTRAECGNEPAPVVFTPEVNCPPVGQHCADACCDLLTGECEDQVLEVSCAGTQRILTRNVSCRDLECTPDTGACCDNDPFMPCTDATVLSDCRCATCTWDKLQTCDEIECPATSIPTTSVWGLAVLTITLMIGGKIIFA